MTKHLSEDQYSEAETAERRDAIIRNMIATPPAPRAVPKAKPSPSLRKVASRKTPKKD